jgi:hypothetical protein
LATALDQLQDASQRRAVAYDGEFFFEL